MILAIVGSQVAERGESIYIIHKYIKKYHPTLIISGGAKGVDTYAEEVAGELHIPFFSIKPNVDRWKGDISRAELGFAERNLAIAFNCDKLLRIVSRRSRTYGSGWTYNRAYQFGKECFEETVE